MQNEQKLPSTPGCCTPQVGVDGKQLLLRLDFALSALRPADAEEEESAAAEAVPDMGDVLGGQPIVQFWKQVRCPPPPPGPGGEEPGLGPAERDPAVHGYAIAPGGVSDLGAGYGEAPALDGGMGVGDS